MLPEYFYLTCFVVAALLGGVWALRTDRSAAARAAERQRRKTGGSR